jgi:hypothetical protein
LELGALKYEEDDFVGALCLLAKQKLFNSSAQYKDLLEFQKKQKNPSQDKIKP